MAISHGDPIAPLCPETAYIPIRISQRISQFARGQQGMATAFMPYLWTSWERLIGHYILNYMDL